MRTSEITTDAGRAYIKCLGNPEGPHALACEWIGSRIAEVMDLQTLGFALLDLSEDDVPFTGGQEEPGPAFATRAEEGFPWAGDADTLAFLCNPEDVPKLVVLDTLLLNRDRHSPNGSRLNRDNVFLSQERAPPNEVCLIAMDFTHAITSGKPIDAKVQHIDQTKNEQVYGLFEQFVPYITDEPTEAAIQALGKLTDPLIDEILGEVPTEWEVGLKERTALRTFLGGRRTYLMETLYERLSLAAGPQREVEGRG